MSIQGIFDLEALKMLPRVYEIFKESEQHERDQIIFYALDRLWNSNPYFEHRTKKQRIKFEDSILKVCRYKGWIK